MVRIAFVTETWLTATDGVVTRLRATLAELLDAGHQVLVIGPRPGAGQPAGSAVDPRVTVRTVPTVGFGFLYGGQRWGLPVPAVASHLRRYGPDVVHVVNPVFLGIAGVIAARLDRLPLVASYHTNVATYAGYYHLGALRPLITLVVRSLHRQAGANLATSAVGEQELFGLGVRNVQRWPPGVDLALFHPDLGPRPRGSRPVALYVGRLAAEKGLHRLRPLAAAGSGLDLVVVGDGPAYGQLRTELGPAARFTGVLHGEALAHTYRAADVFVFPSTTDTLGLTMLEALASGLPVVAVDSVASRELLTGCPAALIVPADDPDGLAQAAAELATLRRTDLRGDLSQAARRVADRYGWGEATAHLLDSYAALGPAGSRGRAAPTRPPTPFRTETTS